MRRFRTNFALSGALIAAALVAPPAGAWHEAINQGKTGEYTVNDFNGSPGVTCLFENHANEQKDDLDRIKIKRVHTHGPFNQNSWVGFRFLIKRNTPPFDDDVFRTVFRSPIQKKRANKTEVAFFRGSWQVPENTNSRFRVQLFFYYYAKGSQTQRIGRVRGLEEVYLQKLNASNTYPEGAEGAAGFCHRNYHGL